MKVGWCVTLALFLNAVGYTHPTNSGNDRLKMIGSPSEQSLPELLHLKI